MKTNKQQLPLVTRQVLTDDNLYKGIIVSTYGGVSRDPNVILNDPNVKELIKLIQTKK